MCSCKYTVLIILLIISVCFAQEETREQEVGRKRIGYKHKLHHLHHNPYFYYLAFLAIKLKFAFVIGTMIMLALFASKTYALLKYGILMHKSKEPEKIYIQTPDHHYPAYFDDDHERRHDSTSSDSSSYGRGFQAEIYNNYNLIQDLMKMVDLNELAFDSLDITQTECKQRFVCEADSRANNDTIINLEMFLIRDHSFIKYRTKEALNTVEDCAKLCNFAKT